MKSNVTLTIIAACVLAACGSSGHKAPVAVSKPQLEAHGAKKELADKSQDLDGQNSSNEGSQPKQEAKQEPEQEPKQEAKQEPKQEAKQEPKQEAKQEPKQESKQEPKQESKQEPKQESKQEPEQESKQEPEQEPKQEPKQELKQEPEQEPKQEPEQESKQEPEQEPKQEPKQESEQEPKQEPKQESKQEPKQESKQEPKQESKQEPKQESKQEPKQESKQEPKQESKQEPKQESKQEPKQESKQEPKQESKQEPKQELKQEPEQESKQELAPELPKTDNSEPQAEARPSDQEVFSRLSPYAKGGLITDGFFKMIFNEGSKKIELDIIKPHHFTGQHQIETLRDIEGALVGYYGYARVAEQRLDDNREQYAVDHHYFMQYADPTLMKRPVGLENITYNGKMLYQYKAYPNKPSEADVEAMYSGMDKTLKMTITSHEDGVWKLHQGRTPKSPAFVNVDERGSVAGNLMFLSNESTKVVPDGHFIGGLYGKNGSVLTGYAYSEERDKEWQGAVGATAVAKPAP